jgi:hypothetical protein
MAAFRPIYSRAAQFASLDTTTTSRWIRGWEGKSRIVGIQNLPWRQTSVPRDWTLAGMRCGEGRRGRRPSRRRYSRPTSSSTASGLDRSGRRRRTAGKGRKRGRRRKMSFKIVVGHGGLDQRTWGAAGGDPGSCLVRAHRRQRSGRQMGRPGRLVTSAGQEPGDDE